MGIQLPALDIRPPAQPENPLEQYGRVLQLKQLMAQQKFQPQMQAQHLEVGRLDIQKRQQEQKDQQAQTAAMQEWNGKNIDELPGLVLKHGASATTVLGMKSSILKQQQEVATYDETRLKNESQKNDMLLGHLDAIKALPDEQLGQGLSQTAAQLAQQGLLDPQHVQAISQLAGQNPKQIRQALDVFEKGLTGHKAQLEQASKQQSDQIAAAEEARKAALAPSVLAESQAKAKLTAEQASQGGSTDETRFAADYMKAQGMENTPENRQKAFNEYTRQTKIAPAQVRVEGMAQTREYPVIDTKNGNTLQYVSAADLNAANRSEPGRYSPAAEGAKALNKSALIEDIRGGIQQVREALKDPEMGEFTPAMRASVAAAMRTPDPRSAVSELVNSAGAQALTPKQQDYLIKQAVLAENVMAMRGVLGAGQGAEDMRTAILRTVPGPMTPSKAYALKQLDTSEQTLDRVLRGVPNVPLRQEGGNNQGGPKVGDIKKFSNGNTGKWDGKGWVKQ